LGQTWIGSRPQNAGGFRLRTARAGGDEEVADAIVWLCLQRSSYVTGVVRPIDGGYTAR
jgi:NAD(P)-dependent dehydrogenase (short-subunit alcohol dehydrogenase family)